MTSDPVERRGRWWPWALGGLVGCGVVFDLVLALSISGSPAFSVEPDYYQKAVDWDHHKAERARSDQLGWHVGFELGEEGLTLSLDDTDDRPVAGAQVRVEVFHNGHANARRVIDFVEKSEGRYLADPGFDRTGQWILDVTAIRTDERLRATHRIVIESVDGVDGVG